jgi:hypothetical protein
VCCHDRRLVLTTCVELALQRIEAQHSLALSRQIGTPNIACKGKLAHRTASVPLALFPVSHVLRAEAERNQAKLIEEVDVVAPSGVAQDTAKPKGILKNVSPNVSATPNLDRPGFEWTRDGDRIKIVVDVPKMVNMSSPYTCFGAN